MAARPFIVAGLAAGAVALGVGVFFVLRKDSPVVSAPVATSGLRLRRCKVHNKQRAAKNGRVRAWLDEWEFSGDFDVQIPKTGGARYDDDREPDGQRWIYAEGRTRPGTIVTDAATASESAHGHEAANDVHPVRQLDANGNVMLIFLGTEADPVLRAEAHARFDKLVAHARAFGLEVGDDFPRRDRPHFQDPDWRKYPVAIRPLATT